MIVNGKSLDEWDEIAWAKVTPELKARMKAAMSEDVALGVLDQSDNEPGWHFSGGMGVRNHFRKTIPDADLPPFPEFYGDDVRNWDDYYVQALELCAGLRD